LVSPRSIYACATKGIDATELIVLTDEEI